MQSSCANCARELFSGTHFCPNCGQKTPLHRLSLGELGHEMVHYFTHADKGIFHLLKELIVHPGKIAREFVEGKRRKYFPPLNFYLIVAAIFLTVAGIVERYKESHREPQTVSRSQQTRPVRPGMDVNMQKRAADIGKFFSKYGNFVPIAAVPLISFFMWLMFLRERYNFTEHFVANMYISGFSILVYTFVFFPVNTILEISWVIFLYFAFEIIYRSISYYYFINKRATQAILVSIISNTVVVVGWGWLTRTLIYEYIHHGFWGLAS